MGRIQVVLSDNVENEFRNYLARTGTLRKGEISEEIEGLIVTKIHSHGIEGEIVLKQDTNFELSEETKKQIIRFYNEVSTLEKKLGRSLIILIDRRINAIYTICNISAKELIRLMDLDPSIDPEYQEEFRANRKFEEDNPDYIVMAEDAKNGRQFSDIVAEFDTSEGRSKINKPIKVFGGQHRCHAIEEAFRENIDYYHGLRIYFNLDKDQRGNIAIVSNTNIHVSNDLRDRLNEQSLDPPNKLRDFTKIIGLLKEKQDFTSKKTANEMIPSVRMMRTFIVNFFSGKNFKGDIDNQYMPPELCQTGGSDQNYLKLYKSINFNENSELVEAGIKLVELHTVQREKAHERFKNMALNLSIISSWAFAAGLLQRNKERLEKLYNLPKLSKKDPLDWEILNKAKGDEDTSTYRGLASRYGEKERARLLELFLLYTKADLDSFTLDFVKLAIKRSDTKRKQKDVDALSKKFFKE